MLKHGIQRLHGAVRLVIVAVLSVAFVCQPPLANRAAAKAISLRLPHRSERSLRNGLTSLVVRSPQTRRAVITLIIDASPLYDDPESPGLSKATAELLTSGTDWKEGQRIDQHLLDLGATIRVSATNRSRWVNVTVSAPNETFVETLETLATIVRSPDFNRAAVNNWKRQQLAELDQAESSPQLVGNAHIRRHLYPNNVLQHVSPLRATVNDLNREKLVEFHREHYTPGRTLVGVLTSLRPSYVFNAIDALFGTWRTGDKRRSSETSPLNSGRRVLAALGSVSSVSERRKPTIYVVDHKQASQTYLVFGAYGPDERHPDHYVWMLLNEIFGAGPASRLSRNLRDQRGLTYQAFSMIEGRDGLRHLLAYSPVSATASRQATEQFLSEFRTLQETLVSPSELEMAKRTLLGRIAVDRERSDRLLLDCLVTRAQHRGDYWNTFPLRIMAVTADDVRRVARERLSVDHLRVVAVGNGVSLFEQFQNFELTAVIDNSGR